MTTTTKTKIAKFEEGKTYYTAGAVTAIQITVTRRTAKMIYVETNDDIYVCNCRYKVNESEKGEFIKLGFYAQAPYIYASNEYTAEIATIDAQNLDAHNKYVSNLQASYNKAWSESIEGTPLTTAEAIDAAVEAEIELANKAEAKNAARFAKEELETEYEIGNLEERYNVAKEIVRYRVNSKGTKCWSVYGVYDNKQIKVNGITKSTAKTGWHNATAKVADDMLVQKVGITLVDYLNIEEFMNNRKENQNQADAVNETKDELIGAPEVNNNNTSDRLAKLDEQKLNLYKAINNALRDHYVKLESGEFYDAADAGFTTFGADSANPAFEKLYCKENGKFVEVPKEALKAFNLLEVEHLVTIKIIREEEARNAVKFETGKYYTADDNETYYVVKRTKTSVILFDCFYTQADGYMDIKCDEDLDDEWEHKTFKAKIQFDERGEFVDWYDEEGELVTLHAKNQTDKPNNDDDPEKSTDDENSEDKLVDAPEVATNDNLTDALAQLAECKKLVDKANDEYLKLTFAVDACFHFYLNKLKAQIFDEHIHPNHKRDFEILNPMLKDIYDKIVAADHLKGWDIYGADIEYCTETAHTGASAEVYHIACDIFNEIRDKLGEETLADELKKIVAEFNLNPDLLLESDSCDFNAALFRDLTELTPNEILNEMGTRLTEGKEIWTNTDINAYSKACDRRVKEIKARLAENISDAERKSLLLEFETGYPAAYQEYIAVKIPVLDDDDEELAKLKAQLDKATAEDDKLTDELFKAREAVKALEEKVFAAEDAKFKAKCAYYNRLHKKAEELTTQLITPEIFNSKAMQITFQSGKFSKIGSFFSTRIANHGKGWEIGKGFVIFGEYGTLAQVKVVINLLKEAIERGDKEFTFPTVEQLNASQVSKEKLNDSLVRAIKLAWAKAVDFYRAKNLTAAEYELKIYKICSDAQKELWEGAR